MLDELDEELLQEFASALARAVRIESHVVAAFALLEGGTVFVWANFDRGFRFRSEFPVGYLRVLDVREYVEEIAVGGKALIMQSWERVRRGALH